MKTSELGTSGIRVSGLALGTWAYSGANVWGPSDDRAAVDTIHCALDHGVEMTYNPLTVHIVEDRT